jgi:hypothetical protein
MTVLPVDFRRCRLAACAAGQVVRSLAGQPITTFVHVVDCRGARRVPPQASCRRGPGNLYIQYWLDCRIGLEIRRVMRTHLAPATR